MRATTNKTVFFLGAGFSIPAKFPSQSDLLKGVIKSATSQTAEGSVGNLMEFIKDAFKRSSTTIEAMNLEDFFSPLDRCITENGSFRGYPHTDLINYRNLMAGQISEVILRNTDSSQIGYVTDFITKVIKQNDPVIITSNWDNLIELAYYGMNLKKHALDYGTYTAGLGEGQTDQVVPSMTAKERGYKTLKLLKIHGSVDWYSCPLCNRMFVSKGIKHNINSCRFCQTVFSSKFDEDKSEIRLNRSMILPTFLKEFGNFHYKSLWYNFHRELSEAKKLVIIGYSLPAADHEIRQAFLRFVPDDCEVRVVTFMKIKGRKAFCSNYRNLFGDRIINFEFGGVESFISNMADQ